MLYRCETVEEKIARTSENIVDVTSKVKSEITVMKDKLKLARETIGRFKAELSKVQNSAKNSDSYVCARDKPE